MNKVNLYGVLVMMLMTMAGMACGRPGAGHGAASSGGGAGVGGHLPAPAEEVTAADAPGTTATAVFAGGCFWCVEAVFEQLEGVTEVVSGYAGGTAETAQYDAVSSGVTDHAEVVRITYDPAVITFGQLLRVFFATHDPTTRDRQGPDWGRQYRSAVFYADDRQRQVAAAYMAQLDEAGVFDAPIVTTLEPLEAFYPAEHYHQDFVSRNPAHPYVRQWAVPKVEKVRGTFADQIKDEQAPARPGS